MAAKPPSSQNRAVSAARASPLAAPPRRITGEMMRVATADTALNAAGVLRDTWDDFKTSDRYFKYKALVIFCWLALSVTSVGVACPSSGFGSTNDVGARLVVAGEANAPIYMVKNDSPDTWQDVEMLVNGKYRSTASAIASNH